MTSYFLHIWNMDVTVSHPQRYITYPALVTERGLKAKVTAYVNKAYREDRLVLPPIDKARSRWLGPTDCALTSGGLIMARGKWESPNARWKTLADLCAVEVGQHEWLERALKRGIEHADKRGHPGWCWLQTLAWRVAFRRATAVSILATIEGQREKLQAWDDAYDADFNRWADELNASPHVMIGQRGAPTPPFVGPPQGEES